MESFVIGSKWGGVYGNARKNCSTSNVEIQTDKFKSEKAETKKVHQKIIILCK